MDVGGRNKTVLNSDFIPVMAGGKIGELNQNSYNPDFILKIHGIQAKLQRSAVD